MLFHHQDVAHFSEDFAFGLPADDHTLALPAMLLSCGHCQAAPGYLCDGLHPEIKPFAVWQYTLSGEGVLEYEGAPPVRLAPGTLLLLTAPHRYLYYPSRVASAWDFLFVRMTGEVALDVCDGLISRHGPVNPLPADSSALVAAKEILAHAQERRMGSRWMASMLAYGLIMHTAKELASSCEAGALPPFVRRAMDYCARHAERPLPVAELAKAAGYSQYHFVRRFTAHVGMPPSVYVREVRLRRARHLLQVTQSTVKEIADGCGFASVSHFTRSFRRRFGMPPGEIRQALGSGVD
jgi:AraC-like DNA-binding protein